MLLEQSDFVASRLRGKRLRAGSISIKIRFGKFQTITRSRTLAGPSSASDMLRDAAAGLFDVWADASFQPVRLIGVSAASLVPDDQQLCLFSDPGDIRRRQLDQAMDGIQVRFGKKAVKRGG